MLLKQLQWNTFTCNRGITWYHMVSRGTTWYHVVPTEVPTVALRGTYTRYHVVPRLHVKVFHCNCLSNITIHTLKSNLSMNRVLRGTTWYHVVPRSTTVTCKGISL
jgi:hypothetical protein